jgi:hypothetical protein
MARRDDADTNAERARLEALAYGADVDPTEAARARIALGDLQLRASRRDPRAVASGREARLASAPRAAGSQGRAPQTEQPNRAAPRPPRPESASAGVTASADVAEDGDGAAPAGEARVAAAGEARLAAADDRVDGEADHEGGAGVDDGGESSLQTDAEREADASDTRATAGWRAALQRRGVRYAGLGVALVIVAGGAFLGGTAFGPSREPMAAATATAGSGSAKDLGDGVLTLSDLMSAPQTYGDQLPGALLAPVRLHTTRLIFTNRSLEGDDAQTPWDVYAAVGNDGSKICLVATPDRLTSTDACYGKDEALHGTVTLIAQARNELLTVHIADGVVGGSVMTIP